MPDAYETGAMYTANIPAWQRQWYESALLETLRTKSILVPYCAVKEDFAAKSDRPDHLHRGAGHRTQLEPDVRASPVDARQPPGHPLPDHRPGNPRRHA